MKLVNSIGWEVWGAWVVSARGWDLSLNFASLLRSVEKFSSGEPRICKNAIPCYPFRATSGSVSLAIPDR